MYENPLFSPQGESFRKKIKEEGRLKERMAHCCVQNKKNNCYPAACGGQFIPGRR
jgi:hypothetical protein